MAEFNFPGIEPTSNLTSRPAARAYGAFILIRRSLSRSRRAAGKGYAPTPPTVKIRRAAAAADVFTGVPQLVDPFVCLLFLNNVNVAKIAH